VQPGGGPAIGGGVGQLNSPVPGFPNTTQPELPTLAELEPPLEVDPATLELLDELLPVPLLPERDDEAARLDPPDPVRAELLV
jgi:hypothetical protein